MLPKVGVYDMAEGLRFMLFENADNRGISGVLKANKVYEPNVQLISSAVLGQAIPGRTQVLDIGANLGSYGVNVCSGCSSRINRISRMIYSPR